MIKFILILLFSLNSYAKNSEFSGFVALSERYFLNEALFPEQNSGNKPSIIFEPEYYLESIDGNAQYNAKLFFRYDENDNNRSHFDIRELNLKYFKNDYEFTAGISKVFWGVTESRHLVDIINQTDLVENIDGEEKLGQAMISLSKFTDIGNFKLFYLPIFRERSFPGIEGRLRPEVPIVEDAIYANDREEFHPDFALRYEHNFSDFDIGLTHFYGTNREPNFILLNNNLIPFYEIISQTSLDLQYTKDAALWKLESIIRKGQGQSFLAFTAGIEYSFYSIIKNLDLGLIYELNRDYRDSSNNIFNNTSFFGARFALNDINNTELLLGVSLDNNDSSRLSLIEFSKRINQDFKLAIEGTFFNNISPKNSNFSFRNDDYIKTVISYYY